MFISLSMPTLVLLESTYFLQNYMQYMQLFLSARFICCYRLWYILNKLEKNSSSCAWQPFLYLISASTSNMAKIEEMERLLREAQAEKQRLLEHRVMSPT